MLLGAVFLAGCVWWTLADLLEALSNDLVTAYLGQGQSLGPVLTVRLIWFALGLLVLHLAFGLLAYALAGLTRAAVPGLSERWSVHLVLAWFLVLSLVVLMANATWYPSSRFSVEDSWLLLDWRGLQAIHLVIASLLALVACLAWRVVRTRGWKPGRLTLVNGGALLLWLAILLPWGRLVPARPAPAHAVPHVVILGLDSLRNDLAGTGGGERLTPNVDAFLAGAYRFSDATSPLARTYPALVSLLTGRNPVTTNARFNLMPRDLVHEGDTLGDALRPRGYRSVYATDEVRFANFDQSFGFDQLISPPTGASDFVVGKAGDLPLVNLLSPTRLAAWIFPGVHANRAAFVTYRPEAFVARLDRELTAEMPLFLDIHLTLPHWPYSWAGRPEPTTPQEYRPAYREAVAEADRQFGSVMRMLERKGVLRNAIVVVLSDHGEALGGQSDSMLRKTGTPMEIWKSLWGHGTSVMSPHQYQVLLAIRAFGAAEFPGRPAIYPWPVSLEDIRPTLQEFAIGTTPKNVDGISLLPYLRNTGDSTGPAGRIRYTETDFNTPKVLAGDYGLSGAVREGSPYYEISPKSGWVQLRADRLPELLANKQRAAMSSDSLLAAIPDPDGRDWIYLYTNRRSPLPKRLSGRPDPIAEPEAARLWDALHARFQGEIPDSASLP